MTLAFPCLLLLSCLLELLGVIGGLGLCNASRHLNAKHFPFRK